MLEALTALSMRFDELISDQVQAVETVNRLLVRLKQLGREEYAKQLLGLVTTVFESIRHQQEKNDPMSMPEFRATVTYALTGSANWHSMFKEKNPIADNCIWVSNAIAYDSPLDQNAETKRLREIEPYTEFKYEELQKFSNLCANKAREYMCGGGNKCKKFGERVDADVQWLKGKNALSDRRAELYKEYAKEMAVAWYNHAEHKRQKKIHWADFTGHAGWAEWKRHQEHFFHAQTLTKLLDESLI